MKSQIQSDQDGANLCRRVSGCFKKYAELPTILDPILADISEPAMRVIQIYARAACKKADHKVSAMENYSLQVPTEISHLFEMLYNLATARGFKYFVRFLPHEAADMEPCVELLYFQNEDDADHWVAPMLALWLSIIVLVPFDIETIDSQQSSYE